ncbi:penicillin acylase family protein [Streptomyces tsukubensis]|uniref:Penicillin acylase family protein n=1 Tax=Streptomyces tsukubensis TaxID=83656 RepID=A0A1V3ZZ73_9ACTN|nr:penicillin acylase family protein [Streptomyces tsukubensis]OON71785.1 penicillin acylase family protein [Streptomyces tsukubensis]QFR97028.1 penicillin acylase family protein [Streptomyces tsukubensis]
MSRETGPAPTAYDVPGLTEPVEILIDRWGVPHLYATSQDDLFLAQGFNAARDRLFQMDLWRRRGLGLLSEVFGRRYLAHDRAARLFLYRGDMDEEWASYGPDTERVTTAFVSGVNAFVALCLDRPELMPPEFGLLGHAPATWSPADVARIRGHGLQSNLKEEVARALTLREHGPDVEDLRRMREPAPHRLRVPEGLDLSVIPEDVLDVYRLATIAPWAGPESRQGLDGSNNWVVAPSRTATGRPLLANDPHRAVTLPALRYLAHLSAPGIDVIGAGEPVLPGISIGHNGRIAFGLTIFPIDQEDLYVYTTDPDRAHSYRYGDGWESMEEVTETIPVKGGPAEEVVLRFTRHGPVIRELPEKNAAFAVRAAWLGPGMAPYLGSVDYMRAKNPDDFVRAMRNWGAPGENQVYAAPDGTIGWRPAGRVPVRRGWDGTLPVPGDGRYEWDGFLDVEELPSLRDPEEGWFATANEMNLPAGYPNARKTVTYDWNAPTRHDRIAEELSARTGWSVADCVRLQTDVLSLPARRIKELLPAAEGPHAAALRLLHTWDARLTPESPAAALFEIWYRRHLRPALLARALRDRVPPEDRERALMAVLPPQDASADARIDLELLRDPGPGPELLLTTLAAAEGELAELLGPDISHWSWGALHRAHLHHPVKTLHEGAAPPWAEVGPVPRGGSGDTVDAAAYGADFGQTGGATFRMVVDVGSWDDSVAMNAPGQSGTPDSPHYADLFDQWASGGAFPLAYSRERVEAHTVRRLTLRPPRGNGEPRRGD